MSKDLIKGKGLILVTGKKGSGKSHFVTSQIKYIVDNYPDHKIYADIDGLNIQGVEKSPEDWQTAEKNSTIIYDEAQRLAWCDNSSTKINSDPRVREMTMIRHENKNIVLITQDPTFIHSALRKLVDVHYHFSHPFKDGKPKCFVFSGAMSTIDDKGYYKAHAVEEFTYHLDSETSKLYKSVDDDAKHDQKKKYPKKVIRMIIFIVLLVILGIPLGIYGIKMVFNFIAGSEDRSMEIMHGNENKKEDKVTDNVQSTISNGISDSIDVSAITDMSQRCRLPQYVQTKECLEWFDSVSNFSSVDKPIKYDINNPHDFDVSQYEYEIKDVPIISGCAVDTKNICTCYTQQMTKLKISNKDCRDYIAGDKPFNPFLERVERVQNMDNKVQNEPIQSTEKPQETQSKIINAGDNKGYFDSENAPLMGLTSE